MPRKSIDLATFPDTYGELRTIHRDTRGRLAVKRERRTPALALTPIVGKLLGRNIRSERLKKGLSMSQLAKRVGMDTGNPKQRIHDIEVGSRNGGVRLGTLYALAVALDLAPEHLLPKLGEVLYEAGAFTETEEVLKVNP